MLTLSACFLMHVFVRMCSQRMSYRVNVEVVSLGRGIHLNVMNKWKRDGIKQLAR